jgi:hypothetical protein
MPDNRLLTMRFAVTDANAVPMNPAIAPLTKVCQKLLTYFPSLSNRMNTFHFMSDPQQRGQGLVMRHHAVASVVSLLQCRQVNLFMVCPCLRVG